MLFGRRPLFYALIAIFLCVHLVLCGWSPRLQHRDIGLLPRATNGVDSPRSTGDVQNTTAEPTAKATSSKEKERTTKTSNSEDNKPAATSAASVGTGIFSSDIESRCSQHIGISTGSPCLDDPSKLRYPGYGLPIIPKITPGLGVAGVSLMIAGLCCCLIGIKIKR